MGLTKESAELLNIWDWIVMKGAIEDQRFKDGFKVGLDHRQIEIKLFYLSWVYIKRNPEIYKNKTYGQSVPVIPHTSTKLRWED